MQVLLTLQYYYVRRFFKYQMKFLVKNQNAENTELETMKHTKEYIDKLANGIGPFSDKPVPDGDIINNVKLSRCFFYISGIL